MVDEEKIQAFESIILSHENEIFNGSNNILFDPHNNSLEIKSTEIRRIVGEKNKTFVCDTCGNSFTMKRSLDKHVTVVHEKIKPFVCESCGYTAGGRATLKRHFEVVHEKKKPFKCIYCDFRTALNANLKKHMNIHKGNESIKYFF